MCAMPDPAAWVLVNPIAGVRGRPRMGAAVLAQVLERHGWAVHTHVVPTRDEMTRRARQAAEAGVPVVFVAGGDGSYRAAAQGLVGTATALGPLPLGSRNVLARSIGLRPPRPWAWQRSWARTAARLARGRVVLRRDVGVLNGLVFLSWAGVGFDAAVVHALESQRRSARGAVVLRYAWAVVRLLGRWPGFEVCRPPAAGPQWMWLVLKEPRYAGDLVRLRAAITPDDGRLAVWRVPGQGWQGLLRAAWAWLWGHARGSTPYLHPLPTPQTWQLAQPQPVHLDGDPLLHTAHLQWEVRARALRIWGPG